MKILKLILVLLWFGIVGNAICDDLIPEKLEPPHVLVQEFDRKLEHTKSWLKSERECLKTFAAGSFIFVLSGIALGGLFIRQSRRCPQQIRRQIWRALSLPLGFFLATGGTFLSAVPLLNSLSGKTYWFDVRLFAAFLTLICSWGLFRLLNVFDLAVRRYANRDDNALDALLVDVLHKTLQILLAAVTLLIIGQTIFRLDITALLAGAGVVGLAVAFAAKDALANFFGTLVIILDHPFRLGDRIQINGIDGIVEEVGMRSTRIRTADEGLYLLPNSMISSTALKNVTRHGKLRYLFDLGLEYGTTPEQMRDAIALIHKIADNFHGPDLPGYEPRIFFDEFGASSLNLRVIVWFKTDSFDQEEILRTELNLAILKSFSDAGINIAFPTTTTYLRGPLTLELRQDSAGESSAPARVSVPKLCR